MNGAIEKYKDTIRFVTPRKKLCEPFAQCQAIKSILSIRFSLTITRDKILQKQQKAADYNRLIKKDHITALPRRADQVYSRVQNIKMDSDLKPFVVTIEGNIGSGKSTMLEFYRSLEEVQLHPEPVDKWTNLNGQNLLQKLYEDPKRWSFQVD